ncbi:TRAP transporter substrate-binding protein [Chitinimonas sp. BJB300]|uniref:TRAP transporter substrate-binding protein n=1 Tax=Chitinimonas sp. BJB300 TaxID=1559339 RepID=UPI000C10202C|nr:TRAP transporter substrate-binding protein DctP [Chitinimonas sp. BJB300]PHV10916.1 ABC transporter substrate-binding protein [Chitinimonas sp. BJB300]TSJ89952.1 twin-arginine translocation signal domain-containing protein [Chitinimonas sp. BJB300]
MERRSFLKTAGVGAVAATGLAAPAIAAVEPNVQWRITSSFPKSLETIYGGAEQLAKRVADLTDGKFQIKVAAAGEIVPGLQALDAVQNGTVQACHTCSYYYVGKNKTFGFDTAVPFGLSSRQQAAWMYYGGGLQLMRDFLKEYNVINFYGGNTGTQMGGWFRSPIKSLAEVKGLKIRIPGIGGEVWSRLGAVPQTIAGGDIYPALEKGTIDAAEWVGPYDDEKLGFYKVAKNYFYPGWWEPGPQISFYVNLQEWAKLPKSYQAAFEVATAEAAIAMQAEYDAKNPQALVRLLQNGVKLHKYPVDIMKAAQTTAFELYEEEAAKNPAFKKVYTDWKKFRGIEQGWFSLAESSLENFMYANRAK